MADATSIDDVEAAVIAVKQLQEHVAGLLEAVTRLTKRVEAIETRPRRRG